MKEGRVNKVVQDPFTPEEMTMHLYSPNAEAINDDPEWGRTRILLGALFRKHGPMSIEILKKGIWVGTTRVDGKGGNYHRNSHNDNL